MGDPLAGKTLGILGVGNMGGAIARGAIEAKLLSPSRVIAADPDPARRAAVVAVGARVSESNLEILREADILVLAVKPQGMDGVLDEIAASVRARHLVLSVAAGVRCERIEAHLPPFARVVRAMPNMPALVRRGATGLAAGARATDEDLAAAEALFGALGIAVRVEEEALDAVTAVSGSGPAYVYWLAEAMIEAGRAEGLSGEEATKLAVATVRGAGELLASAGEPPAALIARVASRGGTTEAALAHLARLNARKVFVEAIRRAAECSRQIARESGPAGTTGPGGPAGPPRGRAGARRRG